MIKTDNKAARAMLRTEDGWLTRQLEHLEEQERESCPKGFQSQRFLVDPFREVMMSAEIQIFPEWVEAAALLAQVLPVPPCSGPVRDAQVG